MTSLAIRKKRFVQVLKERLFLRFHMSLILVGTALAGLLVTKLLLMTHVTNMVIRYPLAVVVAYLAFFGFIKLWLSYITRASSEKSYDAGDGIVDAATSAVDFPSPRMPSPPVFHGGGGGSFGGGGASGSFEVAGVESETLFNTVSEPSTEIGTSAGEAAGDAASCIFEEGGWVLIVLGLLLAIVFGTGLYLVYDAPFILSEAAFDFVLSASLLKSARRMDGPDWAGSVLRTTWKPFLVAVAVALIGAALIHFLYPGVQKLSEIFS